VLLRRNTLCLLGLAFSEVADLMTLCHGNSPLGQSKYGF
jgi:hypothetical protein